MNWIVSQLGARQYYAVPRGFQNRQQLRLLYTDAWCRRGRTLLSRGPRAMRAFAQRHHAGVPDDKVISFNVTTVRSDLRLRVRPHWARSYYKERVQIGSDFARRVRADLVRRSLDPDRDAFFGFDTGSLETVEMLRSEGVVSLVDQIDGGRVEQEIVRAEAVNWPGWAREISRVPDEYNDRRTAEWETASLVVVNSEWSRQCLRQQGVPDSKIVVIPIAYENKRITLPHADHHKCASERKASRGGSIGDPGALRVLWLGTVNLRKGIQYLLEAARMLRPADIQVTVAGPLEITGKATRSAPENVTFVGPVSRGDTASLYERADLFVLPTLSDGFAITQLEAMSDGLPVITTPRCGEVVSDGVDGLIVPPGNSEALAAALGRMAADRLLLADMSLHASRKAVEFSLERYIQSLARSLAEKRRRSLDAPRDVSASYYQSLK